MMKIGQEIKTMYVPSPLPVEQQYKVGEEVEIIYLDTREKFATFIVKETNEYTVVGVINWVAE